MSERRIKETKTLEQEMPFKPGRPENSPILCLLNHLKGCGSNAAQDEVLMGGLCLHLLPRPLQHSNKQMEMLHNTGGREQESEKGEVDECYPEVRFGASLIAANSTRPPSSK